MALIQQPLLLPQQVEEKVLVLAETEAQIAAVLVVVALM
jgi:hypothetical protein